MNTAERLPGRPPRQDPDPVLLSRRTVRGAIRHLAHMVDDPRYDDITDGALIMAMEAIIAAHTERAD
jgi:hypothetical protein